jgi:hypothetical protein
MHEYLPAGMVEVIVGFLEAEDVGNWAQTCRATSVFVREAHTQSNMFLCESSVDTMHTPPVLVRVLKDRRRRLCGKVKGAMFGGGCETSVSAISAANLVPKAMEYWVVVDTDSSEKLRGSLSLVVAQAPNKLVVVSDTDNKWTLQDSHLSMLCQIPFLGIPGNVAVTDDGLKWLAATQVLWISGCKGIRGKGLARLVYEHDRLFSIRWQGGWGTSWPFDKKTVEWLANQESQGLIVDQW